MEPKIKAKVYALIATESIYDTVIRLRSKVLFIETIFIGEFDPFIISMSFITVTKL